MNFINFITVQSNKLSLNSDRAKFTLFHKVRQRDNIPLLLFHQVTLTSLLFLCSTFRILVFLSLENYFMLVECNVSFTILATFVQRFRMRLIILSYTEIVSLVTLTEQKGNSGRINPLHSSLVLCFKGTIMQI